MGPCHTTGDRNGDFLPEILSKYYTHSYADMDYILFETFAHSYQHELRDEQGDNFFDGDAERIIEYLLEQECENSDILMSKDQLHFAAACACASEYDFIDDDVGPKVLCGIAVAKDVEVKEVREALPSYTRTYWGDTSFNCYI